MMWTFFALLSALIPAQGHAHSTKCGAKHPSAREMGRDQAKLKRVQHERRRRNLQAVSCDELCQGCIEIDVYFHMLLYPYQTASGDTVPIVPHPSVLFFQLLSPQFPDPLPEEFSTIEGFAGLIPQQMEVLNNGFSNTPFKFRHANPDTPSTVVNAEWATDSEENRLAIFEALSAGGLDAINVFLTAEAPPDDEDGTTVGLAVFPSEQLVTGDGINMLFSTMPGGGLENNDDGYTLVHEVGHWLGLFHTFHPSFNIGVGRDPDTNEVFVGGEVLPACDPRGQDDFITDTPAMNMSTQDALPELDCNDLLLPGAVLPDTCPNLPGVDPVFNYMNYLSSESCFAEAGSFTCNQIERMYEQWFLYRDGVNGCNEGQMEIEFEVSFGTFFVDENRILLTSTGGTVYYDSTIHLAGGQHFIIQTDQNVEIFVDLCVPIDDYVFSFTDSFGDGILPGALAVVRVNGVVVGRVEGNFGQESRIEITADTTPSTSAPTVKQSACFAIQLTATLWIVGAVALCLS